MNLINPIIYAIDTQDLSHAIFLASEVYGKVGMVKLGLEFFVANGPFGVREIAKCNIPIFLDLKLCDIPNTVAKTVEAVRVLDVEVLTLHINGGTNMLKEAINAAKGTKMKLIGVTVLTSMDNEDLNEVGVAKELKSQVVLLAKLAKKNGLDGIVCSALEAKEVRQECGKNFIIITPGIRINPSLDDQKRTATPEEAMNLGTNHIVVGRTILKSQNYENNKELIWKLFISLCSKK